MVLSRYVLLEMVDIEAVGARYGEGGTEQWLRNACTRMGCRQPLRIRCMAQHQAVALDMGFAMAAMEVRPSNCCCVCCIACAHMHFTKFYCNVAAQAVDALRGRWDTRPSFLVHTALLLLFPDETVLADVARRPMADMYTDHAMADEFPAEFLAQHFEPEEAEDAPKEEALPPPSKRQPSSKPKAAAKKQAAGASDEPTIVTLHPPASIPSHNTPHHEAPEGAADGLVDGALNWDKEEATPNGVSDWAPRGGPLLESAMSLPPGFIMADDPPCEAPGLCAAAVERGSVAGCVTGPWEPPTFVSTRPPSSAASGTKHGPWEPPTQHPGVHATQISLSVLQELLSGSGQHRVCAPPHNCVYRGILRAC